MIVPASLRELCNFGDPMYKLSAIMHVCLVAQFCLTLCNPVNYMTLQAPLSLEILQARILEWVAMPSSRGSSQARDRTQISCIVGGFFIV